MFEYTCGICNEKCKSSKELPKVGEGQVLVCKECENTFNALTGLNLREVAKSCMAQN